jgi:hypothetical protein
VAEGSAEPKKVDDCPVWIVAPEGKGIVQVSTYLVEVMSLLEIVLNDRMS